MPCRVAGGYPPELAWWTGGRPRALIPRGRGHGAGLVDGKGSGGGARASVPGG